MGKRDIKIIIRSINELKEHLSSDEVQDCVTLLKEISDFINANLLTPLIVVTNKYDIKNTNINGWLVQSGKFDESGEYEIHLTKDDKDISINFNVYSETTGKYDKDPSYNSQETSTDIEIDSIMCSIPSNDQLDIPVTDEVKKYAINIISYINK